MRFRAEKALGTGGAAILIGGFMLALEAWSVLSPDGHTQHDAGDLKVAAIGLTFFLVGGLLVRSGVRGFRTAS
jgi:hypothetical protein